MTIAPYGTRPSPLIAPYGTWPSPLTGQQVAQSSKRMGEISASEGRLYWLESRPEDQGRQVIVSLNERREEVDVLPAPWSARSKVLEYGGGSYCATPQALYFVESRDQNIYKLCLKTQSISPVTQVSNARFANLQWDAHTQTLIAVRESASETSSLPNHTLVRISVNAPHALVILVSGFDFISSPKLSPCGTQLAYLTWNHPNMPWDATVLWCAQLNHEGDILHTQPVAGHSEQVNNAQSITQPQWSPDGRLFWMADNTDWWNLYYLDKTLGVTAACSLEADFAPPQWVFGQQNFAFINEHTLIVSYKQEGQWQLAWLNLTAQQNKLIPIQLPINSVYHLIAQPHIAYALTGSAQNIQQYWQLEWPNTVTLIKQYEIDPLTPADIASPLHITLPASTLTQSTAIIHAFFYAPKNSGFLAPQGTLPPLIVIGHGGPTGAADPALNFKIQFWTHRGFAVLDVNYRGSTGYGKTYRNSLKGHWGIMDAADLCDAAEYVTQQGWVNPKQRVIRGSSAGGLTVLCALTNHTTFNAGVSLYGIADLEALAQETHKFEAFYLEHLVGPYPAQQAEYRARSPLYKINNILCPVLLFQGLNDKVVPPAQAEAMVKAMRKNNLTVGYITYPDEAHGFKNARNIQHQLDCELAFYQLIFNLSTPNLPPDFELLPAWNPNA